MTRVAVQIVTFNSGRHIEACLRSVLSQSLLPDEIIVIDNNSGDDTKQKLADFPAARTVFNSENRGFAAAHNQALAMSRSDYVLVLNPDVVLERGYIETLVKVLDAHPRGGSATGLLLRNHPEHIVDSTGLAITKTRRAYDRGSGAARRDYDPDVFGVSGAAALYKRAMIEDVSWNGQFFDESFFAYKEDVDVAWRARLFGWSAHYVPEAVARHERGWKEGERFDKPLFLRRRSYINRYKMIIKNDDAGYLLRHSPRFLAYEAASLLYAVIRDPGLLPGWFELAKELPALWRQRRWIRRRRSADYRSVYRFFE